MDSAQIVVTVAGSGVIAAVLLFFFGPRHKPPARRDGRENP
jgi:hypothetical protein